MPAKLEWRPSSIFGLRNCVRISWRLSGVLPLDSGISYINWDSHSHTMNILPCRPGYIPRLTGHSGQQQPSEHFASSWPEWHDHGSVASSTTGITAIWCPSVLHWQKLTGPPDEACPYQSCPEHTHSTILVKISSVGYSFLPCRGVAPLGI